MLSRKSFPGNVRELSALVENAVLLAESGTILPQHLGADLVSVSPFARTLCTLKEDSEIHLAFALTRAQGDRNRTAQILGVSVRQVQRKLSQMKTHPRWKSLLGDI